MPEWIIALIGVLSPIILEVVRVLLFSPDVAVDAIRNRDRADRLRDIVRRHKGRHGAGQ